MVAIIQARMGSSRLPGKVMKDLGGMPMLARVVRRASRATTLDRIVVATSSSPSDNKIVALCDIEGWPSFRGSEEDVLDRYYRAAVDSKAEAVVRITADCPLIDPDLIDEVVTCFLERQPDNDYAANILTRTYPVGLDVETMSFEALEKAWHDDQNPSWREHVTQYIVRNPETFKLGNVAFETDYSYMRWTVDTAEDLEFVRRVYQHFDDDAFSWRDVLDLLKDHADWLDINRHVQPKTI